MRLREQCAEAKEDFLEGERVCLDLAVQRGEGRRLEDDFERTRMLRGRGGEHAGIARLDDALVGLKIVDALVEIPRQTADARASAGSRT